MFVYIQVVALRVNLEVLNFDVAWNELNYINYRYDWYGGYPCCVQTRCELRK